MNLPRASSFFSKPWCQVVYWYKIGQGILKQALQKFFWEDLLSYFYQTGKSCQLCYHMNSLKIFQYLQFSSFCKYLIKMTNDDSKASEILKEHGDFAFFVFANYFVCNFCFQKSHVRDLCDCGKQQFQTDVLQKL